MANYLESSAQFYFRFDGENDIAAESLVGSINNMIDLISTATNDMEPTSYAKLRIRAIKPGSFQIDVQAIINYVETLLTPENLGLAASIITIVGAVFALKKHLKGKKPKKIEKKNNGLSVTNNDGETKTFPEKTEKYFDNPKYDNCIVNIIQIALDEDAKGLSLVAEDYSIHVASDKYMEMSTPLVSEPEIKTREHTVKECELIIKKPDLIGVSQWGFRYADTYFEAPIEDVDWLESFKKEHQPLMSGSRLIADLHIIARIDEHDQDIPNTYKYSVIKVYGIRNPEEQIKL